MSDLFFPVLPSDIFFLVSSDLLRPLRTEAFLFPTAHGADLPVNALDIFSLWSSLLGDFRISLIITSQDYRSIPNIIRANASGYLIFKTSNKKEYQKLDDEFGSLFENFEELYKKCTDKLYSFMFINLRNLNVYSDFEDLVYEKK